MKYILVILFAVFIPSCVISKLLSSKKTPEYYLNQGKRQMADTDTHEAIKSFTRAIKLNPNYMDAYMERAKANLVVDSIINAIGDYDSVMVRLKPNEYMKMGELYFLKGDALFLLGADTIACRCWRKAKDLNNQTSWDRIRKRCK